MEGVDLNADDEYRTLITQLEQDGLFTVETNSISVSGGKIWIDGNALDANKAAKYERLVNEITRVQDAIRANTRK